MTRSLGWVFLALGAGAYLVSCSSLPSNPEGNGGAPPGGAGAGGAAAGAGPCATGQSLCGGVCVDTSSSTTNCGVCGTTCAATETCVASACTCTTGLVRCRASCVNVSSDPMNCGACAASGGAVCPAPEVCRTGTCAPDCGTLTDCNRSCVYPTTDLLNCGACGNVCSGGRACVAGTCTCPTGQTFCGAACTNTLSDAANCGGCAMPCGPGQTCSVGQCVGGLGGAGGIGGAGAGVGGAEAGAGAGGMATGGMSGAGAMGGLSGAGSGGGGAGTSGTAGGGGAGTGGAGMGGAGTGGAGMGGAGMGGAGAGGTAGGCGVTGSRVRITEIDVGATVMNNEDEAALMPLSISPIPSGGSRLAWMGDDARVHVTQLDASDQVTGTSVGSPAQRLSGHLRRRHGWRDPPHARRAGRRHPQLWGADQSLRHPAESADPLLRHVPRALQRHDRDLGDQAHQFLEHTLPPYSTGRTGPQRLHDLVVRAPRPHRLRRHELRLATSARPSASPKAAASTSTRVIAPKSSNPSGTIVSGGFDWGCSHSGYERVVWDGTKYTYVCENDAPTSGKSGKIAFAPGANPVILPIDLSYTNMGDLVSGSSGGYWLTTSDVRAGQPANMNGLADVRLLHFTTGAPDRSRARQRLR